MKHLKQLAYNVIQFRWKEFISFFILFGGIAWALTSWWPVIICSFIANSIVLLADEQHKYKSTGKY